VPHDVVFTPGSLNGGGNFRVIEFIGKRYGFDFNIRVLLGPFLHPFHLLVVDGKRLINHPQLYFRIGRAGQYPQAENE
jgi:hypothetical protein